MLGWQIMKIFQVARTTESQVQRWMWREGGLAALIRRKKGKTGLSAGHLHKRKKGANAICIWKKHMYLSRQGLWREGESVSSVSTSIRPPKQSQINRAHTNRRAMLHSSDTLQPFQACHLSKVRAHCWNSVHTGLPNNALKGGNNSLELWKFSSKGWWICSQLIRPNTAGLILVNG